MIVSIGSRSLPKITAITRAFSRYPELWVNNGQDEIKYILVSKELRNDKNKGKQKDTFSGISCNPLTLHETIEGAKNRAKSAFEYGKSEKQNVSFGVGIESGMYKVEEAETKYMDTSVCSIYDGNNFYIGFSPSFEYPQKVVDRSLNGEEIGFMEDIFGKTAKR